MTERHKERETGQERKRERKRQIDNEGRRVRESNIPGVNNGGLGHDPRNAGLF